MEKKTYGFMIGGHRIHIKSKTEQMALSLLVKNHWSLIDRNCKIELLGEYTTSKVDKL